MTEAAKNELEEIEPDDHAKNELLGRITYTANGSVATNLVELVPVPESGELAAENAKVIVASDFDTGEDTLAVGFSEVKDGEATITLDPRASIARTNPSFLHDVVGLGMKEVGAEHVTVDPRIASMSPQILEHAGLTVDATHPEIAHAA